VRLAFVSDIHANFPALCEALERARRWGAERVVCAGDVVGGGPHPTEVVRLLMETGVETVCGNVDRKVASLAGRPRKRARLAGKKGRAAEAWAAGHLGERELAWLAALPDSLRFEEEGVDVWVVHGSPLGDTDYIYPSITPQALRAKLGSLRPHLLVCGHSHIPFARRVAGMQVVNCGSAGKPIDGDPRGALALAELGPAGRVACRIARFAYPVDRVARDIEERRAKGASPEEFIRAVKGKAP
jgi:putative phosphoesterase